MLDTEDLSLSGTSTYSNIEIFSSQFETVDLLGIDGDWETVSGDGSGTSEITTVLGYNGTGSYSQTDEDSTISGTVNESGSDQTTVETETTFVWDQALEDWISSGSGSVHSDILDSSDWNGTGTYSIDDGDFSFSGTNSESGLASTTSEVDVALVLDSEGSWEETGGSSNRNYSQTLNRSYIGSGDYTYSGSDGSFTALIIQSGSETETTNGSEIANLVLATTESTATWETTSGQVETILIGNDSYESNGTGSFVETVAGGTISTGVIASSGDDTNYNFTVTSIYNPSSEDWDESGSGSSSSDFHDDTDAIFSGTRTFELTGGTLTNNINGTWGTGSTVNTSVILELTEEGSWEELSATASVTQDDSNTLTVNGSGAFDTGTATGTITVTANQDDTYHAVFSQTSIAGGEFELVTGTATSVGSSLDLIEFNSTGDYEYETENGQVSGTVTGYGRDSSESTYSFASTIVNGLWEDSGSVTTTDQGDSSTDYTGSGDYQSDSPSSGGGTGSYSYSVSGTISESGSNSSEYLDLFVSTLATDGSWTVAGVSTSESSGSFDYSHDGTGTFSQLIGENLALGTIDSDSSSKSGSFDQTITVTIGSDQTVTITGLAIEQGSSEFLVAGMIEAEYTGGIADGIATVGELSGTTKDSFRDEGGSAYESTQYLALLPEQTEPDGSGTGGSGSSDPFAELDYPEMGWKYSSAEFSNFASSEEKF